MIVGKDVENYTWDAYHGVRMGNIGEPLKHIELEPLPETAPVEAPVTAPTPEPEPALEPA